jgi:hypothetical protein
MTHPSTYDWRKHAAMTALPNREAEKAFMATASGFIANRAGILMKDPYRLGFEVVWKNEENTRMVGIFAFRIQDELLYAPVFFIEGTIKGYDLLHRTKSKTFVPFTEDWVAFLTDRGTSSFGKGIPQTSSRLNPNSIEFERIARAPVSYKWASSVPKDILAKPYELPNKKNPASGLNMQKVMEMLSEQLNKLRSQVGSNQSSKLVRSPEITSGVSALNHRGDPMEIPNIFSEKIGRMELVQSLVDDAGEILKQAEKTKVEIPEDVVEKFAAAAAFLSEENARTEEWEAWFDEISKPKELEPVLGQFMTEDGGVDALTKLASLIERSPRFAELINYHCDYDAWCRDDLFVREDKQATGAEKQDNVLVFHSGKDLDFVKAASDEQKEKFLKKGYGVEDLRDKGTLSPVYEYEDNAIEVVGSAGVYKVLTADSQLKDAFVANINPRDLCFCSPCNSNILYSDGPAGWEESRKVRKLAVTPDGKVSSGEDEEVYGVFRDSDDEGDDKKEKFLKNEMVVGKAYCVYDTVSETFYPTKYFCKKKNSGRGGIVVYTLLPCYSYFTGNEFDVKFNPDAPKADPDYGVLNSKTRFVEVSVKEKKEEDERTMVICEPLSLATKAQFDLFLMDTDFGNTTREALFEKISLWRNREDNLFYAKTASGITEGKPRVEMLVGLISGMRVDEDTAEEMLDKAFKKQAKFVVEKKTAGMLRIDEFPDFPSSYDSEFGTAMEEYPRQVALRARSSYMRPPSPRIGDGFDPGPPNQDYYRDKPSGIPEDVLLSAPPEQLAQLAESGGFPRVFEHGVVSSLVDTYDSMAMVEKYLPKWEAALDSMGRALFLFYWKPKDFERAFGTDEMTNMENKLLSGFKSFGDLILDFLKRYKNIEGSVVAQSST